MLISKVTNGYKGVDPLNKNDTWMQTLLISLTNLPDNT